MAGFDIQIPFTLLFFIVAVVLRGPFHATWVDGLFALFSGLFELLFSDAACRENGRNCSTCLVMRRCTNVCLLQRKMIQYHRKGDGDDLQY